MYRGLIPTCTAEVAEAEAAHSTIVRYLAFQSQNATTSVGKSVAELTGAMSSYRNSLSGTDVFSPLSNGNGASIANVNADGMHAGRNAENLTRATCSDSYSGTQGAKTSRIEAPS